MMRKCAKCRTKIQTNIENRPVFCMNCTHGWPKKRQRKKQEKKANGNL
jgi:DNA-directed RNA polymerase subunit RPC12/RpoP